MDNEKNVQKSNKPTLEDLSKEEILAKYKDVLTLAKKAKKAKDELAKENIQLKAALEKSSSQNEAHEKNLDNMQEVVSQFTEQKLLLTMEISELKRQQKSQQEDVEKSHVENEKLNQQLQSLMDENAALLSNVKHVEDQLQQVNAVGKSQREHLDMLERELQTYTESKHKYEELKQKYDSLKELNSGLRQKVHLFRDRFKDVQEKLRKLQVCKKVLLETQHEYADAVSAWQVKIVKVSQQLCEEIQRLRKKNEELTEELQLQENNFKQFKAKINAKADEISYLIKLNDDEVKLPTELSSLNDDAPDWLKTLKLEILNLKQQLNKEDEILKTTLEGKEHLITTLQAENNRLNDACKTMKVQLQDKTEMLQRIGETLAELTAYQIYLQKKTQQLEKKEILTSTEKQTSPEIFVEMKKLNHGLKVLGDFMLQQQETIEKLKEKLQQTESNLLLSDKKYEKNVNSSEKNSQMQQLVEKLKKEQEEQSVHMKSLEQEIIQLKANNEKFKVKEKQTNMLNLEIAAAEKTLKELRDKLVNKTKELEQSKSELQESEHSREILKQELEFLLKEKLELYENEKKLKTQVATWEDKYETVKREQKELLLLKDELEKKLEQLKTATESQESAHGVQLEKQQKAYELVQQQCKELENKLKQTHINYNAAQQRNVTLQKQLEQLKADYEAYKLKAQTVFSKQQNNTDKVKLLEVETQLETLEQARQVLKSQLLAKQQESKELQENLQIVMREREELHVEFEKLQDELKCLKVQNQALQQQHKQQLQKQQDALQQQRLHIEQLKESHQEELQQLLMKYKQQTREPLKISEAEQARIDINLMEREAAEGSEATELISNLRASNNNNNSNNNNKVAHEFMPLDELLSTSMADINEITTINQRDEKYTEMLVDPSILAALEKKEQQIKHLSSLLAESEQDLAKITQMNDMLKEELRRQERSVERQEHMQNSEYLKNVVFKFLTLSNIDERMRLVPVMSTILKLSRQEMEILDNVAKGQKTTNGNGGGWSFLSWSSGNN